MSEVTNQVNSQTEQKEVGAKNDQRKRSVRKEVEMLKFLKDMAASVNIHCYNGKLNSAKPEAITLSAALFYKVLGSDVSENLIGAFKSVDSTEEYEADYYKAVVMIGRIFGGTAAKQFFCNLEECSENPIAY